MGGRSWGILALVAGLALGCAPSAPADPVTYAHTLTVSTDEGGHVVSDPAGIDCPTTCTLTEEHATDAGWGTYQLAASGKGDGWKPLWVGCDSDTAGVCSITLDGDWYVDLYWDDVAAPTITSFSSPAKARDSAQLSAEASDNDAVAAVRFYFGDKLVSTDTHAPYAVTADTSNLRGSSYDAKAVAVDGSGNESESPVRSVAIDHHVKITADPGFHSETNDPNVALSFKADADAISIVCSLDSGQPTPCSSPWSPGIAADGPHTLSVTATDDVGNQDTIVRQTTLDRVAPVITMTGGPADGAVVTESDITYTWTVSEQYVNWYFWCKVDLASYDCQTPSMSLKPQTMGGGEHTVYVFARDGAGNVSSVARRFTVPAPAPVIAAASLPDPRIVVRAKVLERATRLSQLFLENVADHSRLVVRCFGASCPVERTVLSGISGKVSLDGFLHHSLRPGVRLRLTLTRRGDTTLRWTVRIRRGRRPLVA